MVLKGQVTKVIKTVTLANNYASVINEAYQRASDSDALNPGKKRGLTPSRTPQS